MKKIYTEVNIIDTSNSDTNTNTKHTKQIKSDNCSKNSNIGSRKNCCCVSLLTMRTMKISLFSALACIIVLLIFTTYGGSIRLPLVSDDNDDSIFRVPQTQHEVDVRVSSSYTGNLPGLEQNEPIPQSPPWSQTSESTENQQSFVPQPIPTTQQRNFGPRSVIDEQPSDQRLLEQSSQSAPPSTISINSGYNNEKVWFDNENKNNENQNVNIQDDTNNMDQNQKLLSSSLSLGETMTKTDSENVKAKLLEDQQKKHENMANESRQPAIDTMEDMEREDDKVNEKNLHPSETLNVNHESFISTNESVESLNMSIKKIAKGTNPKGDVEMLHQASSVDEHATNGHHHVRQRSSLNKSKNSNSADEVAGAGVETETDTKSKTESDLEVESDAEVEQILKDSNGLVISNMETGPAPVSAVEATSEEDSVETYTPSHAQISHKSSQSQPLPVAAAITQQAAIRMPTSTSSRYKQMFLKYFEEKVQAANNQKREQPQSFQPLYRQRPPPPPPPPLLATSPPRQLGNFYPQYTSTTTNSEIDPRSPAETMPDISGITPRNLTSTSQRIAQLFQDLNQKNGRVSRFTLPSSMRVNRSGELGGERDRLCGDVVTIDTNIEISSPNYPDRYPPNMDCVWSITGAQNRNLRVQIFKLNLEQDRFCRFDYLDIQGVQQLDKKTGRMSNRTKRYCGTYTGEDIDIGANTTTIMFHSDASTELNGFHLRVIAEAQDCVTSVYVHNSSYITSPKFPNSYDDSKNCWTTVSTAPDHRLLVEFEVLKLEPDSHCSLDYVEIFDSKVADTGQSLGRFCTFPDNSSLSLYSNKSVLLFHFSSDNFLTLLGYKARLTALRRDVDMSSYTNCAWSADWANMTITSPFYPKPYPIGARCETSISAAMPDERIIILFDWIDLVDDTVMNSNRLSKNTINSMRGFSATGASNIFRFNCSHDRLEIWESIDDKAPSNVFCGYRSQPFKYVSTGNSIRLVFRSAEYNASGGQNQDRLRKQRPNHLKPGNNAGDNSPGFKARFTFIQSNSIASTSSKTKSDNMSGSLNDSNMGNKFTVDQSTQTGDASGGNGDNQTSINQQAWPVLVRRPQNASVMLGSSHILHCEVRRSPHDHQPPPQIIWFKGDREIHDGVSPDGTSLLIRQFQPSSVGRYICVYGDNSSDAWLTAREDTEHCSSSAVLFRERPRDQYTSEGEFVMLHCSVTVAAPGMSESDLTASDDALRGPGAPRVTWQRVPLYHQNGMPLELQPVEYNSRIKILSRGDLLFDPALVEDSGFYFCVARPADEQDHNDQVTVSKDGSGLINDEVGNTSTTSCAIKAAARVQINQRVDVSQFCGRSFLQRNGEQPKTTIGDVGKIIGGTEAEPGEFPWMVMFWDEKRHVFCGGALINERWVVTAAHCFTDIADESTVFVKLGKYDQTTAESTEIVTKIQHIIKHPHFSNETFDNDIALVKLQQHITFTDYISPICMPTSTEEVEAMNLFFFASPDQRLLLENGGGGSNGGQSAPPFDSETKFGYVTGWGRLKENGPLPRYLHKIRLPIVEQDRCHRSTSFKVTDSMFCAGYGKEIVGDACKGDSGGPFAVLFEHRWTLLGIVSWGEGCGRPEKYGYYSRVNKFVSWIRRLTRHNYSRQKRRRR